MGLQVIFCLDFFQFFSDNIYCFWDKKQIIVGGEEGDLEKAEESEIKMQSVRSKSTFSVTTLKTFTMWITTNCGKFFKTWQCQTTLPAS